MFGFIKRIRQRRRQRKDDLRYLKCPHCGSKFWGCIPTSLSIRSYHAHCPRCHNVVTEEHVTLTRRQVLGKWARAVAAFSWHCLLYPVKPLTATKKVVQLEARVVEEVARVEAKVDAQGEVLIKRLDVQDHAIAGIGSMIKGLAGASEKILFEAPDLAHLGRVGLYQGNADVDGRELHVEFTRQVVLNEIFHSRPGGLRTNYLFRHLDGCISSEIFKADAFHMQPMNDVPSGVIMDFLKGTRIRVSHVTDLVAEVHLISLLSGNRVQPFIFHASPITQTLRFDIEHDGGCVEDLDMQFFLHGVSGRIVHEPIYRDI